MLNPEEIAEPFISPLWQLSFVDSISTNKKGSPMKSLETQVPPPLVMLSVAFLMWLVNRKQNDPQIPKRTAYLPLLAGLGLLASAAFRFFKQKTSINPHHPEQASDLVHSGVYKYTRNPMYLGMASLLSAWAIVLGSRLTLLGLPLFVLYLTRFQIQPEERALQHAFGQAYLDYQARVRRWL